MAEQRVTEAAKMGFEVCILPQANKEHIKVSGIKLVGVRNIQEVMGILMKK
jgi:DNA repair protein RadA/Sms